MLHFPTKETYPLRWENGTLKLAAATCGAKEAKRVPARLSTAAATRVAAVPATRRSGKTEAQPSSAAAKGGCDERAARAAKTKEAKEKEKNEALARLQDLGSAAYKLSRSHLEALARALEVSKADRGACSKKELFRTVAGFSPAGGLRPGRPGREIP